MSIVNIPDHLNFGGNINLEAFARTVAILENTPDENFNIGSWSCGTVHCAVGLAACDPWFNQQGFYLDEDGDVTFKDPKLATPYAFSHWHAVARMFNMRHSECEWLFSGETYHSEYPEPTEWTDEELEILTCETSKAANVLHQHIPKSAVIGRLKQVLELHNGVA